MISNILGRISSPAKNISQHSTDTLKALLKESINMSKLKSLWNLMEQEKLNFWQEINQPIVNQIDLNEREEVRQLEKIFFGSSIVSDFKFFPGEHYFEFMLKTDYCLSPDKYFFSNAYYPFLYAVAPEISFLRLSKYFPHYLGRREKYVVLASKIAKSGLLDNKQLAFYDKILKAQMQRFVLLGEFNFNIGQDGTLDRRLLKQIRENGKKVIRFGQINYLSLQLPGLYYKI